MLKTKGKEGKVVSKVLKTEGCSAKGSKLVKLQEKAVSKAPSRTKSKSKTLCNSISTSKKNLHSKPPKQEVKRKLVKSGSQSLIGKLHLLRWCTQVETKVKTEEPNVPRCSDQKQNHRKMSYQQPLLIPPKPNNFNGSFSELLSNLSKQMEYQKQLRNMKHIVNQSNFGGLSQQLRSHNISEQELQLQLDQYDPLYIPQQIQNLGSELIKLIRRCDRHWFQKLYRRFSKDDVMKLFEKIDSNMNGLVDLKSLTRELGDLLGKVLRKKDVIRVYRRLENINSISLCTLMGELCQVYDTN